MALDFKRSDLKEARAYERSRGMEPNPGVTHMSVVSNPGSTRKNPFQWIDGSGQRHRHVSPSYPSLKSALGWKKRNQGSGAKLYPVDERGTIVSRPVSKKLLSNRRTGVAYNIQALRKAMRSNPGSAGGVRQRATAGGVELSSSKPNRRKRKSASRRRSAPRRRVTANRRSRRSSRRRSSVRRNSRRRSSKRRAPRRNSRRRASRRRASRRPRRNSRRRASRRSSRPRRNSAAYRKGWGKTFGPKRKRTSRAAKVEKLLTDAEIRQMAEDAAERRKVRRILTSRKKRAASRRPATRRTTRRRATRRKTSKRRASKRRTSGRRRSRRRRFSPRGYVTPRGRYATVAPRYRTSRSRSGSTQVWVYPGQVRRYSKPKRRTSKRLTANLLSAGRVKKPKRGWGKLGRSGMQRPYGRNFQVLMYGSRSRSRKGRRITGYPVYVPGHIVRHASVRRYRGLGGAAKDAHARAKSQGYRERKKYPARRIRKNSRRLSMGRRRSRRGSRRRTTRNVGARWVTANGRRRRRRSRRNVGARWVVANRRKSRRRRSRRSSLRANSRRRGRRRIRRNIMFGADLMKDVLTPVIGGTAGFVAARVLSNALANVEGIRNILDKDTPAADATNTKIAANVLGILATLGLATKVKAIRDHRGALITGMGLALADRALSKITGPSADYLSGLGEYVATPLSGLGEYVATPLSGMGEYVATPLSGVGEYVATPLSGGGGMGAYVSDGGVGTMYAAAGLGTTMYAAAGYPEGVDPANQASVDNTIDVMEAAAGTPVAEAAAGMGTMYAAAGLGTMYAAAGLGHDYVPPAQYAPEADASLRKMWGRNRMPFTQTITPTGIMRDVSRKMPWERPIKESLVTPEGRGYAGGLFARNLFAGMF